MRIIVVPIKGGYQQPFNGNRTSAGGLDIDRYFAGACSGCSASGATEAAAESAELTAEALGRLVETLAEKFMLTADEVYYIATGDKDKDKVNTTVELQF